MIDLMQWLSILMAFISAGLWFWSTQAKVPFVQRDGSGAIITEDEQGRLWDDGLTSERQGKISAAAAVATGLASLFAAIAMLLAKIV